MTNWELSHVFADIIRAEGRKLVNVSYTGKFLHTHVLPVTRFWGTWFFGGGDARRNGMW